MLVLIKTSLRARTGKRNLEDDALTTPSPPPPFKSDARECGANGSKSRGVMESRGIIWVGGVDTRRRIRCR